MPAFRSEAPETFTVTVVALELNQHTLQSRAAVAAFAVDRLSMRDVRA
jgi:hypothetical protein